ncbi:hypothetical protein AA0Z99_01395 [Agrococcus sp. 1P02AA]|uniref:hypothetical protein n=1 Tax=Agrococcus sp. 1P02AA TaxID=3132259 RepID=UPI0039A64878
MPDARDLPIRALPRAVGSAARDARARGERVALRALGVGMGAGQYDDRPGLDTLRRLARLRERNLRSRRSVLGDAPAVVVMTTTASRIAFAWAAIESIAAGSSRPQRLVLWLDDPSLTRLPRSIERLERRGLEVRHVPPGLGVHTKWRPHALSERVHALPMVTSDDDQLYPHGWLAELLLTAAEHPATVVAHRAHEISAEGDRVGSYLSWSPVAHTRPSYAAFGTSVSGQLLPPGLVDALRDRGEGFLERAPHQDDVWLHATAVATGFRTVQVRAQSANYPFVPGTQTGGLYIANVFGDGNDRAIAACLGPEERARVIADRAEPT